ncbi:MAG: UDP-glucose--hexose-1-phosphate uridylyltransferase [Clostridia bacterium]|nr:UDP-glucose--hexose-1-phosphate uridylyltransferase [Clostridia bacterium]
MKATNVTNEMITRLLDYARSKKLIGNADRLYCANLICDCMGIDSYEKTMTEGEKPLNEILEALCDIAVAEGIIQDGTASRDRFDTKLMGFLMPRPSDVNKKFKRLMKKDPKAASDYFYAVSVDSNYIRADRIAKDRRWSVDSRYGKIDISINLSKPEKDPRDIAAAKSAPQTDWPKCLLCKENVGFAGNAQKPARQNLRQIPMQLGGEKWLMQYSPYVYYNEHCIVLSAKHSPMSVRHETFERMLDFVTVLPHYFIGSNADLPIVGGSILSHDHMQGGCYEFPMERAESIIALEFADFPQVKASIVDWPMSVIRLRSDDKGAIVALCDKILAAWRTYSDADAGIFAETDGVPHNTITPIGRRRGSDYEIDLVLRNNITDEAHPLGVFHPHADKHNIKKENIGLIEVMGLAILPARLLGEMSALEKLAAAHATVDEVRADAKCSAHADWYGSFRDKYNFIEDNAAEILRNEIGKTFTAVLEDAGVYKTDAAGRAAFLKFTSSVGAKASV